MRQIYFKYYLKNYSKRTQSFTGKTCSPLLCYRFVSTTLTAQIPAETLSQSHRLCFMLLHYHYVITALTVQIPNGNAITNSQGLLHTETGFCYFGA